MYTSWSHITIHILSRHTHKQWFAAGNTYIQCTHHHLWQISHYPIGQPWQGATFIPQLLWGKCFAAMIFTPWFVSINLLVHDLGDWVQPQFLRSIYVLTLQQFSSKKKLRQRPVFFLVSSNNGPPRSQTTMPYNYCSTIHSYKKGHGHLTSWCANSSFRQT